ncbi:MAG: DUF5667 domain-containing protein [Chloroflexota bacterium]
MNRKEEILASCIDEVLSGRSTVEQCLARYPQLRNELKPLLEVALSIQPPKVTPSPEFRNRLRNHLLDVMEPAVRKEMPHRWSVPALSFRAVAIALLAFIILATGGTGVYAAQSSLPGETLYPVKIGTEKLQMAATVNPEDKAYLHLKLAQRRVEEVAIQASTNRTINVSGLATLPAQTDAALREIEKTSGNDTSAFLSRLAESTVEQQAVLQPLVASSRVTEREQIQKAMTTVQRTSLIAQAAYSNSAFLKTNPSARDQNLERGQFKISGILLSIEGQTWKIGGLVLSNVRYSGEIPPIGSGVRIEGLRRNNETYIIRMEVEKNVQKDVKIEGVFKGTDPTGKTWNVSDVTVEAPSNKPTPAAGEKVEVQAQTRDGALSVTNVNKARVETKEARLEGKLAAVDTSKQVITVNVAGARISLNISNAKISTTDGKEVTARELTSLIGKDIKANGLVKKDNTIYAREIIIDIESGVKVVPQTEPVRPNTTATSEVNALSSTNRMNNH